MFNEKVLASIYFSTFLVAGSVNAVEDDKCQLLLESHSTLAQQLVKSRNCTSFQGMTKCAYQVGNTKFSFKSPIDIKDSSKLSDAEFTFITVNQLDKRMNVTTSIIKNQLTGIYVSWKRKNKSSCLHDLAIVLHDKVRWGTLLYSVRHKELLKSK